MQEPEEAISNNVATGCEQCELPVESGSITCIPRKWFNNRGLQGWLFNRYAVAIRGRVIPRVASPCRLRNPWLCYRGWSPTIAKSSRKEIVALGLSRAASPWRCSYPKMKYARAG